MHIAPESEERDEIDDLYETQGEPVGLAAAFVARVERLFLKLMRFDEACEMGGPGK